jgi:uncharacterized protein (DUF58 family)
MTDRDGMNDPARVFARVKTLQLVSTKLIENLLSGAYRSVFRGPGIEFDEVREYVEGDDARLIDWNVSSRLNSAYTKVFREERELTLCMILDVSGSLRRGPLSGSRWDIMSFLSAVFSFAAVQNNDRVGALFFSDRIESWVPPVKGKKHALRLLQDILSFKPEGTGSDLGLALRTAQESLKRRGMCVIISDFKTSGYLRDLSLLARKHDVIAVRITDPVDHEYPVTGLVHLEDPETGHTILASGRSRKFRRRYRDYWEIQRRQWKRECARRGIAVLEISTTDDPTTRLVQFFRRRRAR